MRVLTCHDDAFTYEIMIPEDAAVSDDCVVTIGVEPNEIVGSTFPLVDFMLVDGARDRLFPGLVLLRETSRLDNPNDAEMLRGLKPLKLVKVEELTTAP